MEDLEAEKAAQAAKAGRAATDGATDVEATPQEVLDESMESATSAEATMTCLMVEVEPGQEGVQADPDMLPREELLEWLCTCWGQEVPYCLRCKLKVGLAEAAAADAAKPHCTDEVCQRRMGYTTGGWRGRCQEDAKPAMSGHQFSHRHHIHLKQFMQRAFRPWPYAIQEYPNDDDNGYLSGSDGYHSESEPTVQWRPDVEYSAAYVHLPWCRRSCGCRCNPHRRAPDFTAYRHSDNCRGGCQDKCAGTADSAAQIPTVEVIRPEGGWGRQGSSEPPAQEEERAGGECGKCWEALALTMTDEHAVEAYGMAPKPAHEHCHQCDAVARVDEPGRCPVCNQYYCRSPVYASTEGTGSASGDLSPVTPASERDESDMDGTEATGCSGAGSGAELMSLMADVAPSDKGESQEPSGGMRDPKFSWSLLQDGTGVVVHVQGAPKVVVTPDHANRRFHADFTEDTGLKGSLAARAQMNAYIRKAEAESADELGRQLKEAWKQFCSQTGEKGSG